MPRRIAHFISQLNESFGGPVRAIIDLCNAMSRRGHDMTVLTWDATSAPQHWNQPGSPRVIVIDPPARPLGFFSGAQLKTIERHLRSSIPGGASLLHLHGVWDPNLAQLGALARRIKLPYFVSTRGMLDDWCMTQGALKKKAYLWLAGRHWLERAACTHCTAQAEMDQARKWFPRGRAVVIPNLLDLSAYRNPPGPNLARAKFHCLNSGLPTLLFLSRISYKKGVEHLIRAVRLLHDQGRPCHCIIAGVAFFPDYMASLERLTRDLGLTEWVHLPGLVTGADKLSLYQACDLMVIPTSQENFGFVFFEALAAGLPLITTKGVDLWPELEQSAGARISDPSPLLLARAITDLLSDPVRRSAMGAQGRDWTFRFLDEDRLIAQFEEMYERA